MTTPMSFNCAQTFYIDPQSVQNQPFVQLSSIDLFFMFKPASVNNMSGVVSPGVTIYLAPTQYNMPEITNDISSSFARLEWTDIVTSSDASIATHATFNSPITVQTGLQYALIFKYDNNDLFGLWSAVNGQDEVGTTTQYNNQNGSFTGNFFTYVNTSNIDPTTAQTQQDYSEIWVPLNSTTLTFKVYVARYASNGVPIVAIPQSNVNSLITQTSLIQSFDGNALTYSYPSQCVENISFDISLSTVQAFVGAQKVYQNTVSYPGGWNSTTNGYATAIITTNSSPIIVANNLLPNGSPFSWYNIFNNYTGVIYVTLQSNGQIYTNVNKVINIINSTALILDEPVTWTDANSTFMIAPVATVDTIMDASPFGNRDEFMFLTHSNANASVRFVNNCIENITGGGGSGYSNSDILYITGYEFVSGKVTGGYVAVANVVTNGSYGAIVSTYLSNLGCGFTNSSLIVACVANSASKGNWNSNTSAGTGASFGYSIGATLQTEMSNNIFKNCIVTNLDLDDVTPYFDIIVPSGGSYTLALIPLYYVVQDNSTSSGFASYINSPTPTYDITLLTRNSFVGNSVPCFVSYSNEFITRYANGNPNDLVNPLSLASNCYVVEVITSSNNDFTAVVVNSTPTLEFGKFVINNNYVLEETNYGNAWAKHLTTTINFSQLAEDLLIYLDVYRPPNTDIQVYARIQNSGDSETYTVEDYTRLQCISGQTLYSSSTSGNSYIEMGFGFQQQPNTSLTFPVTVTTANASANVVADASTNGQFSSLAAVGNLVKIYAPLFPNTDFIIGSIKSITNNTIITLNEILTSNSQVGGNPAVIGSGMQMDLLGWNHQAYTNIDNSNVVRYYNQSIAKYDGYDILSLKIVMLSSEFGAIPRIHDIRAIGASA